MIKILSSRVFKIVAICAALVLIIALCLSLLKNDGSDIDEISENNNPESTEETEQDYADYLDEQSSIEDEGNQVFYLSNEEVSAVSITDSNGIFATFERTDDGFTYTDNVEISINADRIESIINYLCDIRAINSFEVDDALEYGLSQDSDLFVVFDSAGTEILISFGDYNEDTGEQYFALNYDFTRVFVNSGKLHNLTEYSFQDLVDL